jgi:hypothetical protein
MPKLDRPRQKEQKRLVSMGDVRKEKGMDLQQLGFSEARGARAPKEPEREAGPEFRDEQKSLSGTRQPEADGSSEDEKEDRLLSLNACGPGQFVDESMALCNEGVPFRDEEMLQNLDLDTDPLEEPGTGPSERWLQALEDQEPRTLVVPSSQEQELAVDRILAELDAEPLELSPELIFQTEQALQSIHQGIPDAKRFVAGSFQAYIPAWKRILSKSKRVSSKKVLRWLENGFVPKFVGTTDASEKNIDGVKSMLRKFMRPEKIDQYLRNQRPGPVEFQNHRSFYEHWDFSSGEVANLILVRAGSLLPKGAPKPILVHPSGLALTAGKRRLICDARALNLFLKNFPFQYEKLKRPWSRGTSKRDIITSRFIRRIGSTLGLRSATGTEYITSFASACQKPVTHSPR